jgi:Rieske Fe-S protein
METEFTPNRRTLLAGAAAGGLILAAGCGSNDSSSSNSGSSGSSGSGSGSSGGSTTSSGGQLATVDQIPDGGTISVKASDGRTILLNRSGSNVTALSAKCTHMGCTVAPAGNTIKCPCHGSQFQAGTGAVINGPAQAPLNKVAVKVTGNSVTLA